MQMDESPASPASDLTSLQGRMNVVRPEWRIQDHIALLAAGEYQQYFHTDWETPEQVPWTGLQASTAPSSRYSKRSTKCRSRS